MAFSVRSVCKVYFGWCRLLGWTMRAKRFHTKCDACIEPLSILDAYMNARRLRADLSVVFHKYMQYLWQKLSVSYVRQTTQDTRTDTSVNKCSQGCSFVKCLFIWKGSKWTKMETENSSETWPHDMVNGMHVSTTYVCALSRAPNTLYIVHTFTHTFTLEQTDLWLPYKPRQQPFWPPSNTAPQSYTSTTDLPVIGHPALPPEPLCPLWTCG